MIRIRLCSPPKPPPSYQNDQNDFALWKNGIMIPIRQILVFAEIFCIISYMRTVLLPATNDCYHTHMMMRNIFFLEDHEAPVSNTDDLNEYYQSLVEKGEQIKTDFLLNASFPNESQIVHFRYVYNNGTDATYSSQEVNPQLLKNVTKILTSIPMYIVSSRKTIPECSMWVLVVSVSMEKTDPAFWLSTTVIRNQCPSKIKVDHDLLEYFVWTRRTITPLLFILIVHILTDYTIIRRRLKMHNAFYKTEHKYRSMPSRRQLHYTLGMWTPVECLICHTTLIAACVVLYDAYRMSGIPSLVPMQVFSLACFFHLTLACQWFMYTKYIYLLILIIRDGTALLFNVTVGTLPFLCAASLMGVFMFAHIAKKARSFWGMAEIFNSFEFSNNIENVYNEFSDGTPLFNWLAFFYVTMVVLIAGWIILASFMSAVLCVHSMITQRQKKD